MTKLKEVGMKTPVVQIGEMNERDRGLGLRMQTRKRSAKGYPIARCEELRIVKTTRVADMQLSSELEGCQQRERHARYLCSNTVGMIHEWASGKHGLVLQISTFFIKLYSISTGLK